MKIAVSIILSLLAVFVFAVSKQEPYECHGDVCNAFSDMEPQFCSSVYKMCRDCKDIKQDCHTSKQPLNCSEYCKDLAIEEAFKIKKMEKENTCFVTSSMVYLANGEVIAPEYNDSRVSVGSVLQHRCNNGYSLEGPVTQKCLGNDTWSEIETPYCLHDTWKSYKRATIALIIVSACFFLAFFLLAIVFRLRKGKQFSRTNTDDSLPEETHLLSSMPEDQTTHTEDEHISFTPRRKRDDDEKSTESPVTSPTRPSAPPIVEEPQNENKIGQQNNINNSSSTGPQIVEVQINQVFVCKDNKPSEADGRSAEKPREGATSANQTRQRNIKGIDVKMSTEESNTTDVTEESDEADTTEETDETEAVKETVSDAKSRGTKPLPARGQKTAGAQEEMSKGKGAKGTQSVAAKDESIQSPTKETGQDRPPGKLGFNDTTFQSTDAERSEIQADVAEYPYEVGSTQKLDELKEGIGTYVQTST